MRAIIVHTTGGPEVLQFEQVDAPTPAGQDIVVDVAFAGVNFIDTYQRSGVYPVALPLRPGHEGARTVVAIGPEVDHVRVGDTVAWTSTLGSYSQQQVLRPEDCYRVPAGVGLDTAAGLMLQGITAHYLATSVYRLGAGDIALVHAGAGGVGLLLTQLATARGAQVITTVSTEDKAELSRKAGASHVLRYDLFSDMTTDLPEAVRDVTDGDGVQVVYDGVGAATFDGSLASLALRGTLALFGGASGQVPPFDLQRLNHGGSLSVTRPSLGHFLRDEAERHWRTGELFAAVADGSLTVRIGARFPLADAAGAHTALESRTTTGKVLLEV